LVRAFCNLNGLKTAVAHLCVVVLGLAGHVGSIQAEDLFDLSLRELLDIKVAIGSDRQIGELQAFASIDKVSEQQWRRFGAKQLLDSVAYLPGVDTPTSLGGTTMLSIRGYSGSTASARGKALLIDGIPLNGYAFSTSLYSKSLLPLDLFSSVELAKGPISSFYGADAFHGALLMNPWQPAVFSSEVSSSVSTTTDMDFNARAYYSLNDTVTATSNFVYSKQTDADLPAKNLGRQLDNDFESLSLSQSFDWRSQRVGLLYSDAKTGDEYDILEASGRSSTETSSSVLAYYKGQFDINTVFSVKPVAWYNQSKIDFRFFDETRVSAWADEQYGARVDVAYQFGRHQLTAGLEYVSSEVAESYAYSATAAKQTNAYDGFSKDVRSAVLRYQTSFINERFLLDVGLRYDSFSNTETQELSPKAGVIWMVTPQHVLKLITSQGYRTPAAGEISGTTTFLGSDQLEAETLKSYELIYMFQGEYFNFHSALFVNHWGEAIVTEMTSAAVAADMIGEFVNNGKNSSEGLEAKWSYLHEPLSLLGFINASYTVSQNDVSGQRYELFPEWKLAYGWRYEGERWDLGLSQLHKVNRRASATAGAHQLPNFSEASAYVGYRYDSALITFTVNNLFDKENIDPSIWGVAGGIYQQGISAALGVRLSL